MAPCYKNFDAYIKAKFRIWTHHRITLKVRSRVSIPAPHLRPVAVQLEHPGVRAACHNARRYGTTHDEADGVQARVRVQHRHARVSTRLGLKGAGGLGDEAPPTAADVVQPYLARQLLGFVLLQQAAAAINNETLCDKGTVRADADADELILARRDPDSGVTHGIGNFMCESKH